MASKKDIQAQIDALTAELQSADDEDDTELWVEHPKTKAVGRLRGAHARSFLDGILGTADDGDTGDTGKAKGAKGKAKPGKADDGDDGDDGDDEPDTPPRSSVWGRK